MSALTKQLKAMLMVPSPQRTARAARVASIEAAQGPALRHPPPREPLSFDPNATAELRLGHAQPEVLPFRPGSAEEMLAWRLPPRPAALASDEKAAGMAETEDYIAPSRSVKGTPWDSL